MIQRKKKPLGSKRAKGKVSLLLIYVTTLSVAFFVFLALGQLLAHPDGINIFDGFLFATAIISSAIAIFLISKWYELNKTQKKLQKRNEEFKFQAMLLDEIGDALTATDLQGKITYANRAAVANIGRTPEEIIGKNVEFYGDNHTLGATQKEIKDTTLSEGSWKGEVANKTKDGQEVISECYTWLIKDEQDKPTGMCGVARNITDRKKQQAELLKHKKYLEALDKLSTLLLPYAQNIRYDDFLAIVGPTSKSTQVNIVLKEFDENSDNTVTHTLAKWTKNGIEKTIFSNPERHRFFIDKIWPKILKEFLQNKPYYLVIDKNLSQEEKNFWKDGNIKSVTVLPIITDGELLGYVAFDDCEEVRKRDKIEMDFLHSTVSYLSYTIKRKQIKEELVSQRDFANKIIESAQAIVLILDKDANIVRFNPYFEQVSGYLLEEVKGKCWFDIFLRPEDRQKIQKVFSGAISSVDIDGNINPIVTKDGQLRYIEWRGRALKSPDGKVTSVLSTGQDITERIRNEQELRDGHTALERQVNSRTAELRNTNFELLEAIQARNHIEKILKETEKLAAAGKLAAQIAHEINNPLAGIKNSFLLIRDAIPTDHKYFEYVGMIDREITRVSQIVKHMFDLYRPGTESAEKFGVKDTIREVVTLLKVAMTEKNIELDITCNEDIRVVLSEALFRQVIYNLLQNAVEASPDNTTVHIKAETNNGHLKLIIADDGRGIDDSIKEKIFNPFFTTGQGGPRSGLGLGLAITKDIVNAMQGEIDFVSEINKGTTFNIEIPAKYE